MPAPRVGADDVAANNSLPLDDTLGGDPLCQRLEPLSLSLTSAVSLGTSSKYAPLEDASFDEFALDGSPFDEPASAAPALEVVTFDVVTFDVGGLDVGSLDAPPFFSPLFDWPPPDGTPPDGTPSVGPPSDVPPTQCRHAITIHPLLRSRAHCSIEFRHA